jgi:hypothetical protein
MIFVGDALTQRFQSKLQLDFNLPEESQENKKFLQQVAANL